ncbi:unnamed protein product [Phytophthora fragariaefolia]|uniref:Unnamed protein product n=1 Tax=Phytophthora fragariaefolia TaxID=1490495 RepID=A0A9W6U183_9STRA|nr:unnamed protein product [Phytophthora fragariaefolia]
MGRGMHRKPANDIQFGLYNPLGTNPSPQGRPTPRVTTHVAYRADAPREPRGSSSGDLQWDDADEEDEYGYQYEDDDRNDPQCMSVTHRPTISMGAVYTSHVAPDDEGLSYRLRPGQRRGWWEANAWDDVAGSAVLVHGSIFHHPTLLMLDSGASTSIRSLDLAHRIKLKLNSWGELILNGIDGVKTRVSDQCEVMETLGHHLVYTFDVCVGNIGQSIDCLLGMIFMVAAGLGLCSNEVEVVLPDEEIILLVGGPKHDRMEATFDVATYDGLWNVNTSSTRTVTERRLAAEARELGRHEPLAVERPTYRTPTAILRRPSTPGPASPQDPRESLGIPGAFTLTPDPQVRTAEGTRASLTGSAPAALAAYFDAKVAPETADPPAVSRGASTPSARAVQELERVFGDPSLLPVTSPLTTRYAMLATTGRNQEGEPAVYYLQGSELILLDQLKNQLAYLPDLSDLTDEANIDDEVVGDPDITTPRGRKLSSYHPLQTPSNFPWGRHALPPPARGVSVTSMPGMLSLWPSGLGEFLGNYAPMFTSCSNGSWRLDLWSTLPRPGPRL